MAELVDAPASGAGAGNGVEVRVLFRAPVFAYKNHAGRDFSENSRSDSEGSDKENIRGIFSRKTAKRPFAIWPAGSTYPSITT
jgi:hypothetical protein